MCFCLIHVHNSPTCGDEEVMVFVPGADKVAIAVPLGALPEFLPILHAASDGLGDQCCPACEHPIRGARAA